MSYNKVTLVGRLTADPELKQSKSGLPVTSFNLAVDRQTKEKITDVPTIVAWRNNAEFAARYLEKGQEILVEGQIQTRNYEDKNGNKRTAVEVVADNVSFCGSKAEGGTAGGAAMRPATAAPAAPAASFSTGGMGDFESIEDDDDSLPF